VSVRAGIRQETFPGSWFCAHVREFFHASPRCRLARCLCYPESEVDVCRTNRVRRAPGHGKRAPHGAYS
jgi:hypothetical protein